jgi:hypothetical protein
VGEKQRLLMEDEERGRSMGGTSGSYGKREELVDVSARRHHASPLA